MKRNIQILSSELIIYHLSNKDYYIEQGTPKERKIANRLVFRGAASAHFVPAQG